jgi:hypothetical protein
MAELGGSRGSGQATALGPVAGGRPWRQGVVNSVRSSASSGWLPNTRVQRTRLRSPLTRKSLGDLVAEMGEQRTGCEAGWRHGRAVRLDLQASVAGIGRRLVQHEVAIVA